MLKKITLVYRKLDEIDLKILVELKRDGKITKTKLAERVNLSVSPCHERVKRLEESGYIEYYLTKIDIDKIIANSCFS